MPSQTCRSIAAWCGSYDRTAARCVTHSSIREFMREFGTPPASRLTFARVGATSRALPLSRSRRGTPECPGGGIGRRAGFRYLWPQGRGSSSLLLGTRRAGFRVGGRTDEPARAAAADRGALGTAGFALIRHRRRGAAVRSRLHWMLLDSGAVRVAEPTAGGWQVNQWLKKAVLLSFRLTDSAADGGAGRCAGVGQGAAEICRLGREPLPRGGFPRRAWRGGAPLGLYRARARC